MASDGDAGRRSCATEKRSAMALRGAPLVGGPVAPPAALNASLLSDVLSHTLYVLTIVPWGQLAPLPAPHSAPTSPRSPWPTTCPWTGPTSSPSGSRPSCSVSPSLSAPRPRLIAPTGMNACIFWAYIYVDRFRRVRRLSPIIFSTITVMFLLSAAHVALGFARLIWGFIDHRDASGGPTAFFLDISTRPYVARAAIRTVNAFLGDLIIVRPLLPHFWFLDVGSLSGVRSKLWRCWNIWEFKCNICILPAVMILGSAGEFASMSFAPARSQYVQSLASGRLPCSRKTRILTPRLLRCAPITPSSVPPVTKRNVVTR